MFEKLFGKPKDVTAEMRENPPEAVPPETAEKKPKTIGEIKEAIGHIQELKSKRYDALEKHRDTIQELRKLGVNEYSPDTVPRTETVKDILNPIEKEIAAISEEITNTRAEFDLQPNRQEVLQSREFRLEQLESRLRRIFNETEPGRKIIELDNKIQAHKESNSKIYANEIVELESQKKDIYIYDKIANNFSKDLDRVEYLKIKTHDTLTKSKSTRYDENGFNSV